MCAGYQMRNNTDIKMKTKKKNGKSNHHHYSSSTERLRLIAQEILFVGFSTCTLFLTLNSPNPSPNRIMFGIKFIEENGALHRFLKFSNAIKLKSKFNFFLWSKLLIFIRVDE